MIPLLLVVFTQQLEILVTSLMVDTQILVHKWEPKDKDFGAVLQMDLTRSFVLFAAKARKIWSWFILLPE